jgi:ferredoxin-NADP reductase
VTDPREPRRLVWQKAELVDARRETASARTLVFSGPDWTGYLSGQHVDVRLTAEGGYSAERSYSIAAADKPSCFELTVQRLPDGEVSPYFVDEMAIGDEIEVRGPIGGWFAWRPEAPNPVLLVGGGSGVVPLMAMIRERDRAGSRAPFRLVYSARSVDEVLYRDELADRSSTTDRLIVDQIYTRSAPVGHERAPSRITQMDLADLSWAAGSAPRCYVCGPNGFVESVSQLLIALGHAPEMIRTERFGPTGE